MSGKIYLVQGEGQLVAMTERAYDTEDVLQSLPAYYPDLLAGEQINPESPRRWLLLSREAPPPSEDGGKDELMVGCIPERTTGGERTGYSQSGHTAR